MTDQFYFARSNVSPVVLKISCEQYYYIVPSRVVEKNFVVSLCGRNTAEKKKKKEEEKPENE